MGAEVADEVRRAARAVAAATAPVLERRLVEVYGPRWLEAVNERLMREGKRRSPARGLSDHRFCLGLFGVDQVTSGWVDEAWRRRARRLLALSNAAQHDEQLSDADAANARQIEQEMRTWLATLQQSRADTRPASGRDIAKSVTVSFADAARGAEVVVSRTSWLGDLNVRIPAGVDDGQRLRVPGRGEPNAT